MIKRDQLKSKLKILEEMNKLYINEFNKEKMHTSINPGKGYDFLAAFEANKKAEMSTQSTRYRGKDKQLHRMDEIVLCLEKGQNDQKLFYEFENLESEVQKYQANNISYYLIKLQYGLVTQNPSYTIKSFEDAIKTANYLDSNGYVRNLIPISIFT